MVLGNRFVVDGASEWVKEPDAVLIPTEFRLGIEYPAPAPAEDCYAGLNRVSEHPTELGINPQKTLVTGQSGGGGLAAATALLARNRGGPKICAQMLIYPMLDDRMGTASSKQYMEDGAWTGKRNITVWGWVLDGNHGGKDVSIYAAPARAKDPSCLPTTWIDVGAAEVFRDESVAYATKLWAHGVQCELHVWPEAWHGFDIFGGTTTVGKVCLETRMKWPTRILWAAPVAATVHPVCI